MNPLVSIIISSLSDFVIVAGGCLTTAMVATGSTTSPSVPVLIFSAVTGLISMARTLKATFAPAASTTTTQTEPSGATREVTKTAVPGAAPPPAEPPAPNVVP